jgi:hypothetical protein
MLAETDIPIKTLWLRSDPKPKVVPLLMVEKTPEVMEYLRMRYDQNIPEGERVMLSSSAINTYMKCPMQFYLNNVLRIRREDDPEEGISADIIGNIFHDTAEFFYERLQQRSSTDTITASMLYNTKELEPMLHTAFDVSWFNPTAEFDRLPVIRERFPKAKQIEASNTYKGTALIAYNVLLRYLKELIRYDTHHSPFRIIGTEEERTVDFEIRDLKLKVGGRIDRIDEMDGRLRVVDYKTGYRKLDGVKMENVISLDKGHEPYYLQTFLYALSEMESKESALPIKPILFFPIKASNPDYDPSLSIGGVVVNDFANQFADTFKEGLKNILEDIFNPDKPFTCTTDNSQYSPCKYCKLGQICGKKL